MEKTRLSHHALGDNPARHAHLGAFQLLEVFFNFLGRDHAVKPRNFERVFALIFERFQLLPADFDHFRQVLFRCSMILLLFCHFAFSPYLPLICLGNFQDRKMCNATRNFHRDFIAY